MEPEPAGTMMVKITELKNRLSHYLRRVLRGESILICDRDRVMARIECVAPHARVHESEAAWLDHLERRGIVRRGSGKLTWHWLARRPAVGADVVATLVREREEGR